MKELIKGVFLIVFIVLALLISPVLFLWALNSLAEAGGSTFYIPQTPWNWFVAFIALAVLHGASRGK